MPRIQSRWVLFRNVLWVAGWTGGLWLAWLVMRAGNLILALLLLLLSLGLLWGRAGISIISALIRFCFSPSTPVTKVTSPLSWGMLFVRIRLFSRNHQCNLRGLPHNEASRSEYHRRFSASGTLDRVSSCSCFRRTHLAAPSKIH
jgi:hypothetical protein